MYDLAVLAKLASWYGMPEPFRAVGLMGIGITLGSSESSLTNNCCALASEDVWMNTQTHIEHGQDWLAAGLFAAYRRRQYPSQKLNCT